MPYINKFEEFDAVGAVHIRTGDWSNENTPSTLDQHDGRGTFEEKVASATHCYKTQARVSEN